MNPDASTTRDLARMYITDPQYLLELQRRLRDGRAPHIERYLFQRLSSDRTVQSPADVALTLVMPAPPWLKRARDMYPGRRPTGTRRQRFTRGRFIAGLLSDAQTMRGMLKRLRAGRVPAALELALWQIAAPAVDVSHKAPLTIFMHRRPDPATYAPPGQVVSVNHPAGYSRDKPETPRPAEPPLPPELLTDDGDELVAV